MSDEQYSHWFNKKSELHDLRDRAYQLRLELQDEFTKRTSSRKIRKDKDECKRIAEEMRQEKRYMEWEALEDGANSLREEIEGKLDELAPLVEIRGDLPTKRIVKRCSSDAFRSQGWGAKEYARTSLLPLKNKLERAGAMVSLHCTDDTWELWANCSDHIVDAAQRTIGWEDITSMIGPANPAVLYPGLPQKWVDMHYKRNYGPRCTE